MPNRWWIWENNDGSVFRVCKGDFDGEILLSEKVWNPDTREWRTTSAISEWLFVGKDNLREVTEEEAHRYWPG